MRHLEIKYEIKSDLASDNLGGQIIQGAVHILRNTGWGGSSQSITILHGSLPDLLQYYSFERKIGGYNPFSALD